MLIFCVLCGVRSAFCAFCDQFFSRQAVESGRIEIEFAEGGNLPTFP